MENAWGVSGFWKCFIHDQGVERMQGVGRRDGGCGPFPPWASLAGPWWGSGQVVTADSSSLKVTWETTQGSRQVGVARNHQLCHFGQFMSPPPSLFLCNLVYADSAGLGVWGADLTQARGSHQDKLSEWRVFSRTTHQTWPCSRGPWHYADLDVAGLGWSLRFYISN